MHSYSVPEEQQTSPGKLYNVNVFHEDDDIDIGVVLTADEGSQCDPDPLLQENVLLKEENMLLNEKLHKLQWGVNKIKDDDVATRFYTGLPSFPVFLWLYNFLLPKARSMTYWIGEGTSETGRRRPNKSTLPLIDQLLAVLMRLKVGLLVTDIAERFGISTSRFSSIFTTWICLLHAELSALNKFPSREKIASCLPECMKKFPNLRVILDCTEIYIQKSSSLVNQNLTFSNYKHHTTMKFLIGISPAGVISFVSNAWGGKTSDRQMVIDSGFLDLLEPGDNVMADKGFTMTDLLREKGCTLNIPANKNDIIIVPNANKSAQFSVADGKENRTSDSCLISIKFIFLHPIFCPVFKQTRANQRCHRLNFIDVRLDYVSFPHRDIKYSYAVYRNSGLYGGFKEK
ncbi:uncharacterized protein LOC133182596 [Saccostrea echinata]|uniref:uncharacterized protein LOC133182596 n=1 Tax=Saccostrea echinata TaxID=191078 RepID=UPI002A8255CC|nr:uncharacterized protein LOC133182596 [Saccostrea echinata]